MGKTTLIHKIMTGFFLENTHVTIGVEFHVKKMQIDENDLIFQVWDFGGEERFDFLLPMYINGASGGIFVYDITNPTSLYNFPRWLKVVKDKNPELPILIVGAKSDLIDLRKITPEEANSFMKGFSLDELIEVSAKSSQNIEKLFERMTRMILNKHKTVPLTIPFLAVI